MAVDIENARKGWEMAHTIPGLPNLHAYNVMIEILEKSGRCDEAVQFFERMRGQGIQGDMKTYGAMVDVYAARGDWNKQKTALKVYDWNWHATLCYAHTHTHTPARGTSRRWPSRYMTGSGMAYTVTHTHSSKDVCLTETYVQLKP